MKTISWICMLICLSACTNAAIQTMPQSNVAKTAYVLGIGDKLSVSVFGDTDLSGEFTIDAAGQISMPLIRGVPAAGHTANDLEDIVAGKLHPKYLNDPKVSVQVIEYRGVYILGEVRLPGKYPYEPNMTFLRAAALAGGFTYRASEGSAEISRLIGDKIETFQIKGDAPIAPGDTIYVVRRWF